ncbi:HSP20-like chaperone [Imleria badia]|nr:HSP20-like chaperone [Imleria badia]
MFRGLCILMLCFDPHVIRSICFRMNFYEHADSNIVTTTFELPGLKREDITISLLHNKLTIAGESLDQRPQGEGEYTTRELPYGKFFRVLTVPLGMRPEDFKARMENGLLTLTFPKDPPMQEPHRISIENRNVVHGVTCGAYDLTIRISWIL